jgi:pimeloyl-ACP methyl ester carboxylesterase
MKRMSAVDSLPTSYLTAGEGNSPLILLHGTYWSRAWQPVREDLAAAELRPITRHKF